jgi:hypothetical protein
LFSQRRRVLNFSDRTTTADSFRIAGYEIAMVASQRFVHTAKRAAWTGIDFLPTYDGPPPGFRSAGIHRYQR